MLRPLLLLAGLIASIVISAGGCRSCSNCHDYDPPVAGCDCHACGTERAGSVCGCGASGGSTGHGYGDGPSLNRGEAPQPQRAAEPEGAEAAAP